MGVPLFECRSEPQKLKYIAIIGRISEETIFNTRTRCTPSPLAVWSEKVKHTYMYMCMFISTDTYGSGECTCAAFCLLLCFTSVVLDFKPSQLLLKPRFASSLLCFSFWFGFLECRPSGGSAGEWSATGWGPLVRDAVDPATRKVCQSFSTSSVRAATSRGARNTAGVRRVRRDGRQPVG